MYRSMERCIKEFHLYILAMDMETVTVLNEEKLDSATIIYYESILDEQLRSVIKTRNGPSFYWTFTPVLIEYVLLNRQEEWCTYVDADCYFLDDPGYVFDHIEHGNYSVGIVEHRFRRDDSYDKRVKTDGRFNVAFNTFRNEKNSLEILGSWKRQCLDNCTDKPTGEMFGDQLYLNEWPDKYEGVYIIPDTGIDVAPWNVNNYTVIRDVDNVFKLLENGERSIIYMYHFHALNFISKHVVSLNLWNPGRRRESKDLFELYKEYIVRLQEEQDKIKEYSLRRNEAHSELKHGVLCRIRKLIDKYSERDNKSLPALIRNVLWI